MFKNSKRKRHSNIASIAVALLLVCTMTMTAFAADDLSGTIGVTGLTANSSGAKGWTASAGGAVWEGTTTSSGGCSPTYTATDGTLIFTNNSGSTQVLSFDYTLSLNGGSFTIAGASKTTNGSFSQTLANGASVTLVAKSSGEAANTTKVTLSNIKLAVQSVNITFAAPTNGSYTMNGTAVTANTTVTNPSTTTYKLVATPAECYHFDGWYLGETKVYETATVNAAAFATTGTVTARFKIDPLYNQATVPADSSKTKDQLVSINTYYLHDTTNKLVADGGFPGNNSAYSKTAASKTKDKIDVQYVPYSVWDDSMAINVSGTAMGDYVDGSGQESYAYARVISDVIRIYAKENCNITFDYAGSLTTGGSTATETNANAYTYTYVTTAANATVAQVKGGTQYTGSGTTPTIALSKGNYLYILTEGYARNRYLNVFGSSQFSMSFDYSASISNFTVELNVKKDILTAGFRDNTGKALGSGKISVNNVAQTIGTNGNMTDMSFADQAAVTLTVNTAPANYVHIGWEVTPEGGTATRVYTPTYSRTLTENVTVNALFVPKTIITMGANGYSDATYTDASGTALSGQYVARNAGCTEYYTSLADAFSKTDVVVLLAGSTINGDWTIPSGKTFVIPFGMNDAGSTTPVIGGGMGSWDYCQVNLNGNLNVAGTLLVSAQQNQSTGATGGNPGHLVVASGKTITVSGSLYAYGPVTGAGKVETTATAKIHETAEFSDNAPVMYVYNIYNERSSKEVFPFNTMFINSIEIPVTYQLGATLTAHAAVRYDTTSTAAVPIIAGSGAMMNHTAGTITKFFDASAGQFVFRLNSGSTVNTGSFSITLTVTVAGRTMDITMDSADYYIPLAAPFRFEVAGNLTINDNYKALPGMSFDVQEGGTMTVASGKNLILYRRNDYDYRGKHANSTEQWGYGERAYPINPQRFNGVSYPFSFSNSNMGSAKLNVDGTLIVNGGLYVTNEVQTDTANGLALTADGYNYLTGSGKVDMTNAATSLTEINEVMRAQGTNDLAWDARDVVPLKGLKANATADEAAQYESLSGVVQGSTNANGLNVWSADPCAAGHTLTPTAAAEATCVAEGHKAYWQCTTCGLYYADEACTAVIEDLDAWKSGDGKIAALGHKYTVAEGGYTWAEDYSKVTASGTCANDETHTLTVDSNASTNVETAATCSAEGSIVYTATFAENTEWANLETQTTTVVLEKDENAHAWDNACDTECNNGCGTTREITHSYDSVVTAPTCTGGGFTTHTCSVCGDSYKDSETAAVGCSYSEEWTTDANNHWHQCSVCGEEAEMAAHADNDSDHKCDTCEYVMSECSFTVQGDLKTAGTCMAEAVYKANCSVCGAVSETETITGEKDGTNHTGVNHTVNAEDATCTEAGYTGDIVCECGTKVKTGETIPAKTHDYGETSYAWADDGKSCTAKRTCANDTSHVEEVTATIASEITTPATCTVMGTTTYTATFGVDWATEQTTTRQDVAVIDHTYDRQNTEDTFKKSDATCTDAALYYYSCACGAKGSETFNYGEANGHSYANAEVDFSEDGTTYTVTVTCSVCTKAKTSESLNSIVSDKTAGDCQTNNTTTYSASGEYEGVNYSDTKTVEGEKGDHSYDDGVVTPPTCENGGFTTYTCQVEGCGHSYTDNETAASGHTYGTPIFSWNGYICTAKVVCHCNAEQSVDVEVTSKVTTTATCTVEGVRTYTATAVYNGTTYTSDERPTENLGIDSTNHVNKTEHGQTAATCTEIGYTAGTYCEDCKTWISGHEKIKALEHDWTVSYSWSNDGKSCTATRACGNDAAHNETEIVTAADAVKTAATCLEKGTTTYTANFVADWAETQTRDMQDIAQLEHSYTGAIKSNGNGKDATHSFMCVNGCNEYGGAVTHTWNEGEQTKAPACEVAGVKTYTCTAEGCGATYTEEVAALVHTDADNDGDHKCDHGGCSEIISDCTDTNTDHKCDECDAELSKCTDEDKNHKCDVCGTELSECADEDKDHNCDICGTELSQCADNNNDHKCDVCGTELSECADGNNDHKCDVCGTKLSDCADEDKDHKCDICGTELSQCADNNNDHKCDVCGTKLSECSGGTATCTKKAVCSVCGREYGDLAAHTPAAAVEENRVTSTCTVAGSYDSVVYCSVCKTHEISRETMTLELSDHTYDQKVVTEDYLNTAATCQEKATYFKSCTCGATGEETFEYGDPAGHTYGEPAYSWNDTTLTVTLTCGKCEEGTDNKILTGSAEGTVKSSTVGDCKTNATTTYEATVTLNGKAYPNETTITGELGGHSYSGGSCTICGEADPDAPAEKDINIQIADVPNASKNGVSVIGDVENGLLVIDTIYSDGNSIETVYVHLIKCTLNDGSVVTLKNDDGKYRDGDFTLPDGAVSVTVESRMLGDLNGSGSITLADLVLLRRTVAGNYTLNELQEIVANTNNSFKDNAITITLADMVLLRRHIAGNYDF